MKKEELNYLLNIIKKAKKIEEEKIQKKICLAKKNKIFKEFHFYNEGNGTYSPELSDMLNILTRDFVISSLTENENKFYSLTSVGESLLKSETNK